jgi:hypothetical protein
MRITFAQRMVKTTVLAVLVATPIALACNHMSEFTVSRPNCRACTATGPVAQNPGGSCGYEVTFASVFCDCNPNLDCRSAVDGVNVVVAWLRLRPRQFDLSASYYLPDADGSSTMLSEIDVWQHLDL